MDNYKLTWEGMADGWTSVRRLCLNDRGLPIWCSKEHWHGVDQKQFDDDFKFLMEEYGLEESSRLNIKENIRSGGVI